MNLLDNVINQYSDVQTLAEGGQKKVYSAVHPEFGRVVIKYGEYRYSTTLERITREVDLLREIKSEYYPAHYEFLIEPVRREFLIIEEQLDAVELTEVMDRFSSDEHIKDLLIHLICALKIIWERNIVHRDIKPANILITPENEPRVIDLGIARFLDDKSLTATMARRGPGTPIYASPEQLLNKKSMINIRTDFFLLGLLVLEIMHGYHPFDPIYVGNKDSLIDNIISGTYVAPDFSRDSSLVLFVEKVLDPKPYRRYRTIEDLKDHFQLEC